MLTIVKKERLAFLSIFVVSASLVLLDRLTRIEINSNVMVFVLIFNSACSLLLMICEYLFGELTKKFVAFMFAIILCVCIGIALLTWRSDWKTQTILYKNVQNNRETVEYRMRPGHFEFEYDRQIVKRRRILPYVDIISRVDTTSLDKKNWVRIDEKINEMQLPGEYVNLPLTGASR